jgi:ABC-type microcin C transport system permease subunit YejB
MNNQLLAFNVMSAVQTSYTAEKMSDSDFAKKLTGILKTDVSTARVRQARAALGIKNNMPVSPEMAKAISLLREVMNPTGIESQALRDKIEAFLGGQE